MRTTLIEKNLVLKSMIKNKETTKKKKKKRIMTRMKVMCPNQSPSLFQKILSKSSTLLIQLTANSTMKISSQASLYH